MCIITARWYWKKGRAGCQRRHLEEVTLKQITIGVPCGSAFRVRTPWSYRHGCGSAFVFPCKFLIIVCYLQHPASRTRICKCQSAMNAQITLVTCSSRNLASATNFPNNFHEPLEKCVLHTLRPAFQSASSSFSALLPFAQILCP